MKAQYEQAEHELKVAVERIVRPIRSAEKDKLRMREELFAHALDAFEHELSNSDNKAAAAGRAIARLGDAETTRSELQSTVGWQSRYAWWNDRLVRRPEGVPIVSHAFRLACKLFVMFAVYLVVLIVPLRWDDLIAWNNEGRLTVWFLAMINLAFSGAMFFATIYGALASGLARRSFQQAGDYAKVVGLMLLTAATICGFGWLFTFALCFDAGVSSSIAWLWLPFSAPMAVAMLAVPWLDVRERRPLAEWLTLDLGEVDWDRSR